jgi:hypothetical protein
MDDGILVVLIILHLVYWSFLDNWLVYFLTFLLNKRIITYTLQSSLFLSHVSTIFHIWIIVCFSLLNSVHLFLCTHFTTTCMLSLSCISLRPRSFSHCIAYTWSISLVFSSPKISQWANLPPMALLVNQSSKINQWLYPQQYPQRNTFVGRRANLPPWLCY